MVLINNARAERCVSHHYGKDGTGTAVGPGSYIHVGLGDKPAEESNVPFQSLSDRPNVARSQSTINAPGPGTYAVRRSASSPAPTSNAPFIAPSASAFRARSSQISPISHCPGSTEFCSGTMKDNPGPGEYSIVGDLVRPLQVKKDSSHGLASISFSQTQSSVPQARDPNQFRFTGHKSDHVGPGDYNGTIPTQLRRHRPPTNFHKSPSKRQMFEHNASIDNIMPPEDHPAPDSYTVARDLHKGTSAAFKSRVEQVPAIVCVDTPGPGTYEDEGTWSSEEKPLEFASVRSASDRSQSWQLLSHPFTHPEYVYKVPGPGHYPSPNGFTGSKVRRVRSTGDVLNQRKFHGVHQPHQMLALRDTNGFKLTGFDTSDERIKPPKDNGVPKLTYNLEDSIGQSMQSNLRAYAKVGRKGGFGGQQARFERSPLAPKEEDVPGPGEHQSLEKRDNFHSLRGEGTVSSFKSTQERLPKDPLRDKSQKPDPGTYEAFDKVNYRNKFRRPKTDHLSFGSSATRWSPHETFVGQKFVDHPGPGEYKPMAAVGNVPGGAISSQSRSKQGRADVLGPGMYNTHGSTMHRQTFNVSGPEAAYKAQNKLRHTTEPPNIGGGAGGGIFGTRSRLGMSSGGSGANPTAANEALWHEDRRMQEKRFAAFANASQQGWKPIQDGSPSSGSTSPAKTQQLAVDPAKPTSAKAFLTESAVNAGWENKGASAVSPAPAANETPAAPEASAVEVPPDASPPPASETAPAEAPAADAPPAPSEEAPPEAAPGEEQPQAPAAEADEAGAAELSADAGAA